MSVGPEGAGVCRGTHVGCRTGGSSPSNGRCLPTAAGSGKWVTFGPSP